MAAGPFRVSHSMPAAPPTSPNEPAPYGRVSVTNRPGLEIGVRVLERGPYGERAAVAER